MRAGNPAYRTYDPGNVEQRAVNHKCIHSAWQAAPPSRVFTNGSQRTARPSQTLLRCRHIIATSRSAQKLPFRPAAMGNRDQLMVAMSSIPCRASRPNSPLKPRTGIVRRRIHIGKEVGTMTSAANHVSQDSENHVRNLCVDPSCARDLHSFDTGWAVDAFANRWGEAAKFEPAFHLLYRRSSESQACCPGCSQLYLDWLLAAC